MLTSYYKYYREIKNRFILTALCWGFSFSVCYINKDILLFTITESNVNFSTTDQGNYFIFTNVTEVLGVYMELAIFLSNQIILIIVLYHFFMFISLGLYHFEFIKLKKAFQIFLLTWLLSSIFLYTLLVPLSWNFFLSFQSAGETITQLPLFFEAKLNEYLTYFINLYYISLLNAQFLTIMITFLTSISDRLKEIRTFRKLFYFIFIIFSTLITPPDVFSQAILSLSLIIFYEVLLFLKNFEN